MATAVDVSGTVTAIVRAAADACGVTLRVAAGAAGSAPVTVAKADGNAAAALATLEEALEHKTYLVGFAWTLADASVFSALVAARAASPDAATPSVARWLRTGHDRMPPAWFAPVYPKKGGGKAAAGTAGAVGAPAASGAGGAGAGAGGGAAGAGGGKKEGVEVSSKKHLEGGAGLPELPGAEDGKVVTRFPPEPSGYLHIGHVKAVTLNQYYARRYNGKLLLRFDDTNPAKEKGEFEDAIIADLAMLGVRPDMVSHTSDFFPEIIEYARQAIREGKAYMDDTPQEQMRAERGAGTDSARRGAAAEESLARFEAMLQGLDEGQGWCLRAKFNMRDKNYTCRDPVLFRGNRETPHLRTQFTYKAYPTYDFACPIVDAVEGVTHAMRTTEYHDRDEQYHRIQVMLGLRHVPIISFSRVNFNFTVLSKRKLTWFVDTGRVSGWDDARFPTVRGVLRRGVQVEALKEFILAMGFTKKDVDMEWNKFWTNNKKMIDPVAHRYFAIDAAAVPLEVRGGPAVPEAHAVPVHPKDEALGAKAMFRFHKLLVEPEDANQFKEGEEITLSRWANVIIREVHRRADGSVERAVADINEAGDFRTTTLRIGWVADIPAKCPVLVCEFDYLVTKPTLEDTDDFKEFINEHSYAETRAIGEAALRSCVANQVIQIERRGYFRVDRPYIDDARPLVLYAIPTGKAGAESALSSKIVLADQKLVRDRGAAIATATASASGAAGGGGAKKPAKDAEDGGAEG